MADKLVRGNSMDGAIRVFAAVTTDLVNEAQRIHHTYPVATAALGRLLTGAAIMGAAGLKNETDSMPSGNRTPSHSSRLYRRHQFASLK